MNESQALTRIEPMPVEVSDRHAGPLDMEPAAFRAGLDRRKLNRTALMEWIRAALVEKVDFGSIQTKRGPSKPSLFKPGAEKICGMLGVITTFPTLTEYEQAALKGVEIKSVVLRCALLDSRGVIVAEGVGARSLAQDYGDLNKALKMAEKSAHIDATLRMAGLSEVFTQDIEDMPKNGDVEPARREPSKTAAKPSAPSAKPAEPTKQEKWRSWFVAQLHKLDPPATATGQADGAWTWQYALEHQWIGPEETLAQMAISKVPFTVEAAEKVYDDIRAWIETRKAENGAGASGPPSTSAPPASGAPKAKPEANTVPQSASCPKCRHVASQSEALVDTWACERCGWQWDKAGKYVEAHAWQMVICPIPPKGMKKAEYDKQPLTLGQISRIDNKRFYGLVMNNQEAKGWQGRDGKQHPPSAADEKFANACRQAVDHMEQQKHIDVPEDNAGRE